VLVSAAFATTAIGMPVLARRTTSPGTSFQFTDAGILSVCNNSHPVYRSSQEEQQSPDASFLRRQESHAILIACGLHNIFAHVAPLREIVF
jgi:hypothetical protein